MYIILIINCIRVCSLLSLLFDQKKIISWNKQYRYNNNLSYNSQQSSQIISIGFQSSQKKNWYLKIILSLNAAPNHKIKFCTLTTYLSYITYDMLHCRSELFNKFYSLLKNQRKSLCCIIAILYYPNYNKIWHLLASG